MTYLKDTPSTTAADTQPQYQGFADAEWLHSVGYGPLDDMEEPDRKERIKARVFEKIKADENALLCTCDLGALPIHHPDCAAYRAFAPKPQRPSTDYRTSDLTPRGCAEILVGIGAAVAGLGIGALFAVSAFQAAF